MKASSVPRATSSTAATAPKATMPPDGVAWALAAGAAGAAGV
jgi:hypothetical protein